MFSSPLKFMVENHQGKKPPDLPVGLSFANAAYDVGGCLCSLSKQTPILDLAKCLVFIRLEIVLEASEQILLASLPLERTSLRALLRVFHRFCQ